MGSRVDRADDRAPHRRGGVRVRDAADGSEDDGELMGRGSATCSSRSTFSPARGEGNRRPRDVARQVHAKLVRRHPRRVRGWRGDTAGRSAAAGRSKTGAGGKGGIFLRSSRRASGVAPGAKVQRRAATVGYDWPHSAGPFAKVAGELYELVAAVSHVGEQPPRRSPMPLCFTRSATFSLRW